VKALKAIGEIVTMTGDGVNDAPALKEAHIGVAMGKNGTDVSRSVSDLILKDDNFNTIVLAIKEGRTIFKNIRKFVAYQLSCNFAELGILFLSTLFAPVLGWQIPLLVALQILFMNLVTDDFPSITLGLNPSSGDTMNEAPRKNKNILDRKMVMLIIFAGSLLMIFTLGSYFIAFNVLGRNHEYARTVALFSLILVEIVSAFNFRSLRKRVVGRSLFVNPALFFASLISIIATILIIYVPSLSMIFSTVPLGFDGFIISISFSFLIIVIFDTLKKFNKKRKFFDFEHI
jgi:Ca2+-transporting ATPase